MPSHSDINRTEDINIINQQAKSWDNILNSECDLAEIAINSVVEPLSVTNSEMELLKTSELSIPQQSNSQAQKYAKGRCHLCQRTRKKDSKVRSSCSFCEKFTCHTHAKLITVCNSCGDKVIISDKQ